MEGGGRVDKQEGAKKKVRCMGEKVPGEDQGITKICRSKKRGRTGGKKQVGGGIVLGTAPVIRGSSGRKKEAEKRRY